MTEEELIQNYPRLYHMAHEGAWDAIRKHGLMSATALLDAYGVTGVRRHELGSSRRPHSVPLQADGLPVAVLRDQKPMRDSALSKCLQDGLAPQQWYELLNSRTFFWLSKSRIWTLLRAEAYRDVPQTVLTLDSAKLVAKHRNNIWLSPINSGSTLFNPVARGLETFRRIADFPFAQRAKTRQLQNNVVELVVDHSVSDVADFVLAVHTVRNEDILGEIWRAPHASDDDHP
ncbi:hypothetical protein KEU06_28155 [Pseudaminobacter sp. 19-2017]|uniref:Uncharacterized protein n=1 Tax=Pseudaminobacter soli (ex Zhang et al. 2022) TaxID=2831468 RepID=A0A942E270_9HYPH|nr:hypothetical protein [Pseudaminobacter soli]MBS3652464.1 hypothetical protein [Pseudaminobacter soli]